MPGLVERALGHLLLLQAYACAAPATIAPFLYTRRSRLPCWAGWAVYGHMPDRWSLLGIYLIAASSAASAWLTVRERR